MSEANPGYSVKVSALRAGRYDPAERKRGKRHHARERGWWVYLSAEEIERAGFLDTPSLYYRAHGFARSRNAGSVIVSLYREP